ncbi:MAG: chemotaxis protein CheX [Phycisphaerales bacterium]|nr:chemotaxis protein CheX [Phycisphaerales bacterium]
METAETTTANVQHTECVAQAAAQILSATCGVEIEPLDEDVDLATSNVIIGIISLVGDIEWSVFLGMPSDTAVATSAKFAGFEIPFDSPDMGDAIGELTNMVAGQVKLNLDQKGVNSDISLPSVIRAESMTVLVQRHSSVNKNCFTSELGKFWIGVTMGRSPGMIA